MSDAVALLVEHKFGSAFATYVHSLVEHKPDFAYTLYVHSKE
jgi:hypothetical protein